MVSADLEETASSRPLMVPGNQKHGSARSECDGNETPCRANGSTRFLGDKYAG